MSRRCSFLARALLLSCMSVLACSASTSQAPPSATTFATTPMGVVTSSSGTRTVTMYPASTGLVQGLNTIELVVTDARTSAPVDGLTMSIVPWMPTMGHGSSAIPVVQPEGGGVYVARDVSLFMPGTWQLRTNLTTDDDAVVTVDIE
jgi:YtkA-like